jgi:tetratricopeptide (TPR) repeat protein
MEIHILLAGVEFGPYTDDKARELIADGFLTASDPAKRLDETEWLPLTEVLARSPEEGAVDEPQWDEPTTSTEEDAPPEPPPVKLLRPPEPAPEEAPTEDEPEAQEIAPEVQEETVEPEPEAEIAPPPAPEPSVKQAPAPRGSIPPAAPAKTAKPPTASAAPPLINVTVPARAKAKGVVRTGSLLAKEALQAARAQVGASAPAALTAPLPAKPTPAPVQAKAEPIGPTATLTPSSAPETAPAPVAPPVIKPRSKIVLKDREHEETPAPKARKTIRLTQPISLPAIATAPEPKPAAKMTPPALGEPEPSFRTGKILVGKITRTKGLPTERQTAPLRARITLPSAPVPEKETVPEAAPPAPEPAVESAPDVTPELAIEPPVEPETIQEPDAPPISIPSAAPVETAAPFSESAALPEPPAALLTASGDLAEKRSLKITGALKQPTARTPIRLTTTFPYKPGDSGTVALRGDEGTTARPPSQPVPPAKKIWGPESPASRPIFSPTAKIPPPMVPLDPPRLDVRPPSTKIPVSEMPPEGLKVRSTRRLTGRIPIPDQPKPPVEFPPAPEAVIEPSFKVAEPPAPPPLPLPTETVETVETIAQPSAEIAEAFAPAPDISRPEKVRLRRPVKLELSSRAKLEDSGRLTLEAFSKMASVGTPKIIPPSFAPVEIAPHETTSLAPKPGTPTEESDATALLPADTGTMAETVPLTSVEDFHPPRLAEIKVLQKIRSLPPQRKEKWLWVAYAIIAAGMLAWLLLLYLATHRRPTVAAAAPATAPATPPPATPPPATPPSAPPALSPGTNQQVDAYVSDGMNSFQKGDLDSALAAYNHALDLNPRSASALYNRGLTKAAQDDSDGAVSDFSQALQIDPKMATAYYARGLARHSKGDLDGAILDYNLSVQNDPKYALAYFNRGLIRMQKDDIDGAIVDSGRALDLDGRLIQSYYNRGLGRLAKGALDAALSDMKTFCTLAPQDAYTDYARLYIWLIRTQQNQLAEANQELTQAMNSGWNGAADSMVTKIGQFLLGQIGEPDLLAAAASPIPLKEQGQHCEAWYFIGMRRLEAGDKEMAAVDLRKCVETQKTDYCEYILAQEQLKTLNPGGAVSGK